MNTGGHDSEEEMDRYNAAVAKIRTLAVGDVIRLTQPQQEVAAMYLSRIGDAEALADMAARRMRVAQKELWENVRAWYPEADGFELYLTGDHAGAIVQQRKEKVCE